MIFRNGVSVSCPSSGQIFLCPASIAGVPFRRELNSDPRTAYYSYTFSTACEGQRPCCVCPPCMFKTKPHFLQGTCSVFFVVLCHHTTNTPITSGTRTGRTALLQWTLDSEPIMFVGFVVCACSRHALGF